MDLLNTNEAAKKLNVTPIRVRQLIREGKIEAKQIGRDYVIEAGSLESVVTYGKAGRPAQTGGGRGGGEKSKSFAEAARKYIGSVDSGVSDLGSNKKHLEGFGTKAAEKADLTKRG
jgi:excisionase family DNA binding protein